MITTCHHPDDTSKRCIFLCNQWFKCFFWISPLLFSLEKRKRAQTQVDAQLENATHRGQKLWKTKKTFPTALTHFFNLHTTTTTPENLKNAVSTRRAVSATSVNLGSISIFP
jgi:hypothetical protein